MTAVCFCARAPIVDPNARARTWRLMMGSAMETGTGQLAPRKCASTDAQIPGGISLICLRVSWWKAPPPAASAHVGPRKPRANTSEIRSPAGFVLNGFMVFENAASDKAPPAAVAPIPALPRRNFSVHVALRYAGRRVQALRPRGIRPKTDKEIL